MPRAAAWRGADGLEGREGGGANGVRGAPPPPLLLLAAPHTLPLQSLPATPNTPTPAKTQTLLATQELPRRVAVVRVNNGAHHVKRAKGGGFCTAVLPAPGQRFVLGAS